MEYIAAAGWALAVVLLLSLWRKSQENIYLKGFIAHLLSKQVKELMRERVSE